MKKLFFFIYMIFLMASHAGAQNEMWIYKTDGSIIRCSTAEIDSIKFFPIKDGVDLGLPSGLKWASCNIGASSPEEYGDYFAWGETNTKDYYYYDNYSLLDISMDDISGNAQYDAATAKWGSTWRMPTKAEQEELLNNCTWSWTTQNEVKGYKVIGPNGNSIFLPAAGYRYQSESGYAGEKGYYWSSTPYDTENIYDNSVYNIVFNNEGKELNDGGNPFYGRSIRAVTE